jgi:hypothetical protein
MAIVFAGAPVVNAVVALLQHPPQGGFKAIPSMFWVGILMAAAGGCLVTYFKPNQAPPAKKPAPAHVAEAAPTAEKVH